MLNNNGGILGTIIAVGTAVGAVFTWLKMRHTDSAPFLRRLFGIEITNEDLRDAIDNLSNVVQTQGSTIDWLTQQLQNYRDELTQARDMLKSMDELHAENLTLKYKVAELESQVKALEEELARRKKYTPKAKRSEDENE